MTMRERMKAVPGSYDDFVNSMVRWSERDSSIESAILEQLENKPESDTDDITLVLWKHLGIGEPIEIEEEKPKARVKAAML